MIASHAFLSIVLIASSAVATAAEAKRFIVVGSSGARAQSEIVREGGQLERELRYFPGYVAHLTDAAAARVRARLGGSAVVEEDGQVSINAKPGSTTPTQPAQSVPWGITAVRAPLAFSTTRGAGAVVCVVDTGIQPNHPDLQANILGGENFVVIRGKLNPNQWADDHSHGTHVAGTIAALDNTIGVVGVAPEAKLLAMKVLDSRGSGYLSAVADGIAGCVERGAHVINMSLGGSSDSTLLRDAVASAVNAGVVVVAAAGNESSSVSYPARYPGVLAVSAIDNQFRLASFSNTGPEVSFAAPGVAVLSTVKGSGYATYSGTSMASPHVAGVAALAVASTSLGILADDIGLTPEQQGQGLVNALTTVLNQ